MEQAVKQALAEAGRVAPPVGRAGVVEATERFLGRPARQETMWPASVREGAGAPAAGDWPPAGPGASPAPGSEPAPEGDGALRVLGQHRNCYILASDGEELVLLDQHTAHERVLFELVLAEQARKVPAAQGQSTSI